MLTSSYRNAKKVAKKSSKVALSLVLVLFAFAGFNSISVNEISNVYQIEESLNSSKVATGTPGVQKPLGDASSSGTSAISIESQKTKTKKETLRFPGLDKFGIPKGFTVADSTGGLGPAYFRERISPSAKSYLSTSQIIKTESGAANVFISQTISLAEEAFFYTPVVSFGRSGEWVPLLVSVDKRESERLEDGNYLLTAHIEVESAVESPIRISAEANGRDLEVAPTRVITRLMFDPSKTMVLSQAVYVIESKTGA